MKHLNGLLRPTEGAVAVDGAEIAGVPVSTSCAATVGFVFQNPDDQLFDGAWSGKSRSGRGTCGLARRGSCRPASMPRSARSASRNPRATNPYDLGL